jgi:predicted flap endonuclease-1-like 5' DNA nuclease
MAGERLSVAGGVLAFLAGFVGIYFSGTLLFPNLTPITNLLQLPVSDLLGSYGTTLLDIVFLQISLTLLNSAYGSFWNMLGLLSGAGVLLLSYPLTAGKWVRGVIVGLIGLGVIELFSGISGSANILAVGGGLAVVGGLLGIGVWRVARYEKPEVKAVRAEASAEKVVAEKPEKKVERAAKVLPKGVQRAELQISHVEGIGPVYASRLEKAEIKTLSQLAKSSVDQIASVAKVNKNVAEKWIRIANLLLLDVIDEEAAEIMVVGAGVTSPRDLAERKPEELYEQMQAALKVGKVAIPKGYSFTKQDVEKWINAAKRK